MRLRQRITRILPHAATRYGGGVRLIGYDQEAAMRDPDAFEAFRADVLAHVPKGDRHRIHWQPLDAEALGHIRPHWPTDNEPAMVRRILSEQGVYDVFDVLDAAVMPKEDTYRPPAV